MGDRNTSSWKSVGPDWWNHLERITIVAAPSLEKLPGPEEVIAYLKTARRKRPLRLVTQTATASFCSFVSKASDEQVAQMQEEMLIGRWEWRGQGVWAAYWGDATDIDRIVGVEKNLPALIARITAKVEFETRNAAMDQQLRIPVPDSPKSSARESDAKT